MSEQATANDDGFAHFWEGLRGSLEAAEDRIDAPRGLITDLMKEPGFIFMIGVYGVIEPIMNDLLCAQILTIRSKHHPFEKAQSGVKKFVRRQGYSAKADLLSDMGLIGTSEVAFIKAVGNVRDRYAHNVRNLRRTITEMALVIELENTPIISRLTNTDRVAGPPEEFSREDRLRIIIMKQLADFLAGALQTLKPPAFPFGSGLMGFGGLGGLGGIRSTILGDATGATELPEPMDSKRNAVINALLGRGWSPDQMPDGSREDDLPVEE